MDDPLRDALCRGGVTATRSGLRSICAASSAIACGMVAEKNSVCRSLGSMATIWRMS